MMEEDFQDREAEEGKHDLDGLFFRDDALSDDEAPTTRRHTHTRTTQGHEGAGSERSRAGRGAAGPAHLEAWRAASPSTRRRKIKGERVGADGPAAAWPHWREAWRSSIARRSARRSHHQMTAPTYFSAEVRGAAPRSSSSSRARETRRSETSQREPIDRRDRTKYRALVDDAGTTIVRARARSHMTRGSMSSPVAPLL